MRVRRFRPCRFICDFRYKIEEIETEMHMQLTKQAEFYKSKSTLVCNKQ